MDNTGIDSELAHPSESVSSFFCVGTHVDNSIAAILFGNQRTEEHQWAHRKYASIDLVGVGKKRRKWFFSRSIAVTIDQLDAIFQKENYRINNQN